MRRSMCEAIAPERAGHLRHDRQVGGRIRKSPARHRIAAECQRDHGDDGLLFGFAACQMFINGQCHMDSIFTQRLCVGRWG